VAFSNHRPVSLQEKIRVHQHEWVSIVSFWVRKVVIVLLYVIRISFGYIVATQPAFRHDPHVGTRAAYVKVLYNGSPASDGPSGLEWR
jgi:hypothetical protein